MTSKTAKSATEFSANIDRWAQKFKLSTEQLITAIALRAFENIVRRTPVGNPDLWKSAAPKGYIGGTARNSWYVSLGARDTSKGAAKPNASGAQAMASFSAIGQRQPNQVIWLNNNAPHIKALEYGHSTQAPEGMVRITLSEIQTFYKQDVDKVRAENGI